MVFHWQLFFPKKCAKNLDEHDLGVFSENILLLLEQRFCKKFVNICMFEFAICSFPRKYKVFTQHEVGLVILTFYFDLVLPLYYLT